MIHLRPRLLPALALILACGSSSDPEGEGGSTATPGSNTTPTTAPTAAPTAQPATPTSPPAPTPTPVPPTPVPPTPTPVPTIHNLAMLLTEMTPALNKNLYIRAWDAASTQEVGRTSISPVKNPSFTVSFPGVAVKGHTYYVDIWLDWNGNGTYEAPTGGPQQNQKDQAWRVVSAPVNGDTNLNFAYNNNYTDVQWPL